MSSAFADTHNVVAILTKSDASEGFDQILDFLNGSYIKYALTVNPHIYVSCIKHSGTLLPLSNQLTSLEGVDCLPNEEIFTGLARMGYKKPSTKLTFYKAFFSSQWKFLIHTILQSLSAKCTSWNEFIFAMASAVICLSTARKFNFSKYIFDSLVRNVDSSSKFYMYPRFIQLIIQNQLGDLSTHTTQYTSPALTQKVFANIKRVGKGFLGVETPLFEGMLVVGEVEEHGDEEEQDNVDDATQGADTAISGDDGADFLISLLQEALDACATLTRRVEHLEHDKMAQDLEITKLKTRVKKLERANKVKPLKLRRLRKVGTFQRIESSDDTIMEDVINQGRMIDELDRDEGWQAEIYQIDMDHAAKVLSMQEEEPEVQEVLEVVTTSKLITESGFDRFEASYNCCGLLNHLCWLDSSLWFLSRISFLKSLEFDLCSVGNISIETFNGKTNFSLWRVRALMKQQGIWAPLAGPKPADMTDAKYNSQDEKAHFTFLLPLSDEVLYEVADEETAAGVRKKIE
nr:hypothetical protein [Tanacetum cinerariifolium]